MGNRTLVRKLAILMILVAVVLGFYTVRLGNKLQRPEEPAAAAQPELPRVVVAVEAIDAGRPIPESAVSLEAVGIVPTGAFLSLDEVIGRELNHALSAGEPVMDKHFRAPGPIAGRLEPEERAVAVKVDGVIGLGGFIQPGDRVDVLVYLARDQYEIKESQARLLLPDVRVLAYGGNVDGRESDGDPHAKTAVLAVTREATSKLMLGASKGRLRLALRGGAGGPEAEAARARDVVTLAALQGIVAKRAPAKRKRTAKRAPKMYRGAEQEITRY